MIEVARVSIQVDKTACPQRKTVTESHFLPVHSANARRTARQSLSRILRRTLNWGLIDQDIIIRNFIRYLHLEKPIQRERLLPELAERNKKDMEEILNKFKRKPLLTSAVYCRRSCMIFIIRWGKGNHHYL